MTWSIRLYCFGGEAVKARFDGVLTRSSRVFDGAG